MYKVRIFESSYPEIVEAKLNDFLATSKNKFIDVKYNSSMELTEGNREIKYHSVLLIYKEIKDE